ncbi:MAG: hypothetical protein JJ896_18160 [Rhodothermales bacterium]|nr:hypothetical protein [Rhodothermales bacterium]MBO6781588.1 hypothetical protein [Rhodothermales bacterium]
MTRRFLVALALALVSLCACEWPIGDEDEFSVGAGNGVLVLRNGLDERVHYMVIGELMAGLSDLAPDLNGTFLEPGESTVVPEEEFSLYWEGET